MSVVAVAKKDFQDAIRSRWLLGLTALFILLVSLMAYIVRPAPGQQASANALLDLVNQFFAMTLIPLIALIIAYNAISGERESGSLKLLLSLPHSRADVVFGKVIGRSAALAVPIIVGFVLPAIILAIGPFTLDVTTYLGYTLLVCFLGTVFVAIAVGFSAAVESQRVAIAGAIFLYFLFVPLWGAIQFPLQLWLMGGTPGWLPLEPDQLMRMLQILNPRESFNIISTALLADQLYQGDGARLQVSSTMMMLSWILVPPLLGLLKFDQDDL